ncbi:sensor histidine kinase [Lentzea cavernae]|uniref:histidine kinase n=1 Tax=Lentzea cavernae TaxID=2020703 RepID=A0ABQ3MGN5_9PSEU|nr:histidine kinase [Lentzea cavernae]GHH41544.1 two-component sensor histidine kinase [Lentzea cavernae]
MELVGGAPVRTRLRPAPLIGTLAAVGACWGALVLVVTASGQHEGSTGIAFSAAVGGGYLVAGVIAAYRRPEVPAVRIGLLMVLIGIGWFAEDVQISVDPVVHTVGLLLRSASAGFLVHLLLAYPDGVLRTGVDRVLTAVSYTAVFVLIPVSTLSFDTLIPNLLLVWPSPYGVVARAVDGVQFVIGAAVTAVLVRRWVTSSRPARRVLAPLFAVGLFGGSTSVLDALLGTEISWHHDVLVGMTRAAMLALPLAFLSGVWRVRLGRTSVANLLARMPGSPPGRLRALLAQALGDPSLQVGYHRPEHGDYVDADGRPVPLDRAFTPVDRGGRRVAVLVHDPALQDDHHVLLAVASAAALELDNQRLAAEVRAQLAEVKASRARIVAAGDEQRRRVERDLHDGAQQRLVTAALTLRLARQRLVAGADAELDELLRRSAGSLEEALAELRELARGIHPSVLSDLGLKPALRALAARSPQPVELVEADLPDLSELVAATAYYVAAESVTNALKHASADHIRIEVDVRDSALRLAVVDDGTGGADPARGTGLTGLRDRVSAVDGVLTVRGEPGTGTSVIALLPLERP